jgi:hypothetical protein
MNSRRFQRVCWWFLVVIIAVGFGLSLVLKRHYHSTDFAFVPIVGYALVGMLVAARRPESPIGWVFLLVGLDASLLALSGVGSDAVQEAGPPVPWWGVLSVWSYSLLWFPLLMLVTTFTFLLFPSGLPSRRWRPILWLAVASTTIFTAALAIAPTLDVGDPEIDANAFTIRNPLSPSWADGIGETGVPWWIGALLVAGAICGIAAIGSVGLRTWRSRGVERLQMRLFAFAIVLVPIGLVASNLIPGFANSVLEDLTFAAALTFIVVSCGIAILRYHLYDIDRIIGRTTAYGLVTAALLAVYFAVVTTVTQLLPESGDLAVAAATLAAAAVFRPVLGWAQRLVNRRFNREQYDAERAVEQFAGRLRDGADTLTVRNDLLTVLDHTVQPAAAGLWLVERSGV